MELLSGHKKIITKSGISLNVGTLNQGVTVIRSDLTTNHQIS
jgi:translation initiation factor 6 (eIF-6)